MKKAIILFDNGNFGGAMEVEVEEDSLLCVLEGLDEETGKHLYILYVQGMDYGFAIPKEIFDKINSSLDQSEEGDG